MENVQKFMKDMKGQMTDISAPLEILSHKMHNIAVQSSMIPVVSGNLQNQKTITITGKNKIRVTHLMPYAEIRYETNNLHPQQTEWYDKIWEERQDELDTVLFNALMKEIGAEI